MVTIASTSSVSFYYLISHKSEVANFRDTFFI